MRPRGSVDHCHDTKVTNMLKVGEPLNLFLCHVFSLSVAQKKSDEVG